MEDKKLFSSVSGDVPSPAGLRPEAIAITVARASDIPAIQETAAASWWATYGDYLDATYIKDFLARAYSESRLLAQLTDERSHFLVVKRGDEVIGFGQVGPAFEREQGIPVAPADLYRLYFLPDWQRLGLGSRLLAALEGWLRQQAYPIYGAYVHERNKAAQRFYQRQGFVHRPACDVPNEWYIVKELG